MGLRYRKSISLGRSFRINISKSGIGYSLGVKGYRVTKTSRGTTRRTASIPGSGISYVTEKGKKKGQTKPQTEPQVNHYDAQKIQNENVGDLIPEGMEEILASARRVLSVYKIALYAAIASAVIATAYSWFWLPAVLLAAVAVYCRTAGRVGLDYELSGDAQPPAVASWDVLEKISKSEKLWRVSEASKVKNKKYSGGAGTSLKRIKCKSSSAAPFPFKLAAEDKVMVFKSHKEKVIFFPDKLVVISGSKIGAQDYNEISLNKARSQFIEDEKVPKDTKVLGYTWKYVNASGGPDKRFNNNKKLPICDYGKLSIESKQGLNTVIMYSNSEA